jgi:pimeloyl-ACP methyl ester carboxylesterase
VRAAILDGVVPQDEVLGAHVAPDAQRALDHILERCASMPACQAAFPRTKQEFTQLVASLEEKPIQVILPDPRTGESRTMLFTRNELATAVHLLSYTPETASLLPLVAQYLMANDSLNSSVSSGLNYAVLCAEDVPFLNIDQARQASQGTYLGEQQIDELLQICQTWPHGSVPPDFKQAIVSATPTLLLSGEDDPVTPPENAERVSRSLPNSLSLVASGQGHNVIYRGCFPDIAARFIESGSLAGLETGCVQEIAAAPFFLNYSGPQP